MYHGNDQTETIFREFENLKNTTKELKMYMSVIAKMIASLKNKEYDQICDEDDNKICRILIDAQDCGNLRKFKEQALNIQKVCYLGYFDFF